MKIGELARRSGRSTHTLRYYERIGLLPPPQRDNAGRRDYDASVLVWLAFLERLRATGMPIREMLDYAALRALGDETAQARCTLLEAHRERVREHMMLLQASLDVLDTKIEGYHAAIHERTPTA